uniref:Uncharacterized protein n=1 Tax=Bubo bubo TaxID=30461 RepID=A0A8C0FQH9_BUBBB
VIANHRPGALHHKESACLTTRHAQLCGYTDLVAARSNFIPSDRPTHLQGGRALEETKGHREKGVHQVHQAEMVKMVYQVLQAPLVLPVLAETSLLNMIHLKQLILAQDLW